MKCCKDIDEILFTRRQIGLRVRQMARQIASDYAGQRPLVIGILKGACMFTADLLRCVEIDCDVDFICASSYGRQTSSSGMVKILKDSSIDCADRSVLLVEDIIDSGVTLSYIKRLLLDNNATSVNIATLLSKPSRRKVDVDVKYVGFEIPDKFVVGYGMDYDEKYRTLDYIGVLKKEIYAN